MPTRDLQHRISVASSLAPGTMTATTTGTSVDTLGYESVTLVFHAGAMTGTTPSYTPTIQTSADGSTNWLNLGASAYIGGVAPSALTAAGVEIVGVKSASVAGDQDMLRFVRMVATVAGTTPSAGIVGDFILGFPRHSGNAV